MSLRLVSHCGNGIKRALLILIMMSSAIEAFAQQDVQFSQYMLNPQFYNAGWAGVDKEAHISAMHRTQWLGYSSSFDGDGGAPASQLVSFSAPFRYKEKTFGAGVNVVNDRLGAISNFSLEAVIAYHKKFRRAQLSIGIKPGIVSHSLDGSKLRFNNPDDPLNTGLRESQTAPNLGIGAVYTTRQYQLGIGITHLLNPSFDFGLDTSTLDVQNQLERNVQITGTYFYKMSYKLMFTPSILVRTDLNTYSFDLSALVNYDEKIWGGVSYRDREALVLLMGYSFLKDNKMRLGYAFDYVVSEQKAKQPTSHEMYVRYNLPNISIGSRKIIRTPRFRF